jgi:DNA-binding MarR family transcriptional regulator
MSGVAAARLADEAITRFVRAFGLHHPQRDQAGQPVSMSAACSLTEVRRDGTLRQWELGQRLGLKNSNTSHLVTQLVERGWLRRQEVDDDRRGVRLRLTPAGERTADHLAQARRERLSALLDRIPVDQHADVLAVLVIIANAADPRP